MRFTDEIFQPCWQGCSDNGALLWPEGDALTTDGEGNHYADVPADTPDIPNLDFYTAAVSTVFCPYTKRLDAARDYVRTAHEVAQNPTEVVLQRVQRGDHASMLELAMRYGSGCEAEERLDKTINLIERILAHATHGQTVTPGPPTIRVTVPKHVLQRTHSAAALAFYSKYRAKGIANTPLAYHHDPDLLRAATEADQAVAAGLPSRAALLVASHLVALGRRPGCEGRERFGPRTDRRFGGFTKLWEAYAAHRKLVSTIREKPNLFWCGAGDCDVRVLDKHELKRCGGSCPPETKPSYCSKECQRRDWKSRHKAEGCVPVPKLGGGAGTPDSGE
ncbi:hypothetical protein GSI_07487 [Ganoderma sinense ZZ0214-1]|uniref:MYND-type domain-containing protein n=1 Tax=Ganoderma sinense ZZ0214-1 TaxID=1077348 RepID=A0A2G8S968_9APHY|nr:hypothetical protein GSI_07487 [Ganoderma sinense ZZ0214-1]